VANDCMLRRGGLMKRILYVEGCRDGTVGGSHTCLYTMLANLDKRRVNPVVVFYHDHLIAEKLRGLGIETHIFEKFTPIDFGLIMKKVAPSLKRVSLSLLPLQKSLNLFWFFLRPAVLYAWYLKKHSIDIVHLNNSLNTNHEWMVAAKLAGAKIISHERGISENLSRTSKFLGNILDLLICVSKVISDPLLRQGLNKSKIVVVYDGIDTSKIIIKNMPEYLKPLYGIGNHDPVIGVVGNIKAWKGQETVVRATAILKKTWPGIRCLFVGGTVNGDLYKKNLEQIIEELRINENTIFTGFQDNPADFMNVMDVVVHSSIEPEPFGMVNLEAMYLKKPVISTNIGGPTEIFEDGEDGILIEPGNPELLAQQISVLLNSPELRDRMGQKAYEAVISKFRISDTVSQVEEAYEKMCWK
jgi:glycosyltransferase involved in cell wall biosynthesis